MSVTTFVMTIHTKSSKVGFKSGALYYAFGKPRITAKGSKLCKLHIGCGVLLESYSYAFFMSGTKPTLTALAFIIDRRFAFFLEKGIKISQLIVK